MDLEKKHDFGWKIVPNGPQSRPKIAKSRPESASGTTGAGLGTAIGKKVPTGPSPGPADMAPVPGNPKECNEIAFWITFEFL